MKTFISPTASKYLKMVEETLIQQEELFTEEDKALHPFWKRVLNTVVQIYHANKVKVQTFSFFYSENGYTLSVNSETIAFLHESNSITNPK